MNRFRIIISLATPLLTTTLLQGCAHTGCSVSGESSHQRVVSNSFAAPSPGYHFNQEGPATSTACAATPLDKDIEQRVDISITASNEKWIKATRNLSLEAYHLIWSPGAAKKMAIGLASVAMAHAALSAAGRFHFLSSIWSWISRSTVFVPISKNVVPNIILPLFASSCCLLQLGINLLAGGCAGFNTVLGPTRPYFLSLLLYWTAVTHHPCAQWYRATALRWGMALLPEVLDVWNRYQEHRSSGRKEMLDSSQSSIKATVLLDIPTMGCVACINKIDSSLRNAGPAGGRVVEVASALNPLVQKGGQARVRVVAESREKMDELLEWLVHSVETAGFEPCRLDSVKMDTT